MPVRIAFYLITCLLSISIACNRSNPNTEQPVNASHQLSIKGVIEGYPGAELVLEEMGAREYIPVDTVLCDGSGAFEISFTADQPAFYVLRYGNSAYVTLLMEPGESLKFEGTAKSTDEYRVQGSPGSALLRTLSAEHKHTLKALGEIARKNMAYVSSPEYPALKAEFDRQFDSITDQFREYSVSYMEENAGSLAILVALYNLYGQGLPVFHPGEDLQVYKFVDSALMIRYSDFEAVKLLHAQVIESEHLLSDNRAKEPLQKGKIAPDFVSSRPDGSQLALSDLKDSYVLLNFWAAWSRLSREENPNLKEAMETYGDKPFKILQVSLDEDREVWLSAIREDQLNWNHVSDLKRWEGSAVDLYHVDRIPFNVLIDPSGRIMEINLFGAELINKLEHIFN
ncbi:MAG: TlpA disulfide reductase family protein [Bacteroidota bacterium]